MSIEKEIPSETKVSRAYKIEIDKSIQDAPKIVLSYTNDTEFLGTEIVTPQEVVEQGILTIEEVQTMEANLKKIADFKNPYLEVQDD